MRDIIKDYGIHSFQGYYYSKPISIDELLEKVKSGGSKVYGGFGIYTGQQAKTLASKVEAVVAGSVFVKIIAQDQNNPELMEKEITEKARELSNI